ncbi:hypothetical protein [Candidatus Villigracilis proximus]|uniref:hypothetical protein n=1 Tax=Candidatus Villigracilis proximus TaxID=3140683 RepID=UPI0031E83EA5
MAIFLLKARNGSGYTPPAVGVSTGFADVATDAFGAAFINGSWPMASLPDLAAATTVPATPSPALRWRSSSSRHLICLNSVKYVKQKPDNPGYLAFVS